MKLPEDAVRANALRPVIVVLSHLRWDFVFQRPQHLMTRAARDHDVYFIEEPLFEGRAPGHRESVRDSGVCVVQPVLPKGTSEAESIQHQGDVATAIAKRAGGRPLYLWYYTPMAMAFGDRISADAVIFDKMDELSAFAFAPPALLAHESALMATADLVFTGGAALFAAARDRSPAVHCFPSSIDTSHFGRSRDANVPNPDDQAHIFRPRVGFFGVIDERIDLELVQAVAALRPDWQLVMVGPTAKIDPASLPQAPNIHWLGPKPYADLPQYMAHWDMGWMPFALNESTRFISPTKTPEFLAAGLPLLSTAIDDVVEPYGRLKLVDIIGSAEEAVSAGDRLLAAARNPASVQARRAAVDAQLSGNSWDATWSAMRDLILRAVSPARKATSVEVAHV